MSSRINLHSHLFPLEFLVKPVQYNEEENLLVAGVLDQLHTTAGLFQASLTVSKLSQVGIEMTSVSFLTPKSNTR